MDSPFSDFVEIPFPDPRNFVYVICFVRPGQQDRVPFYVGETTNDVARFIYQAKANWFAPTDFKVGEAVGFLRQLGYSVFIKYRESSNKKKDRLNEESRLIKELKGKGYVLLNDLKGYKYRSANKEDIRRRVEDERRLVHDFVKKMLG